MNRKNLYYELNTKLSLLSDEEIKEIIQINKPVEFKTWGVNKIYKYEGKKIFIKAIPVAKLYQDNKFNTKNLYNIPAYYNYGFGSAGVNPWRELLLYIKTTNFVLINKCDFFSLLYHYRIIEDSNNDYIESGLSEKLLTIYGNNENIIKYLQDRIKSKIKIVLFLEYIPNVAWKYLQKNYNFTKTFYLKSMEIINFFLHKNNISHNDGHLGNFIIDNKKNIYITDFGLSLDKDFDLDKNEKIFMENNKKLDKSYVYKNILDDYTSKCKYNKKINKKYNLEQYNGIELYKYLIDNIDIIKNDININNFQINFIKKNQNYLLNIIQWKINFKNIKNKNKYFINLI